MLRRKKAGQSTAEYAIVIGLVIAAAVAMQVYVKRGIQAKVKGAVDYDPSTGITNSSVSFTGEQYEPYYAQSNIDTSRNAAEDITTENDGIVTRGIVTEKTSRTGTQNILPAQN